ncbi:hypothetical protein MKX01_016467 [Papaver californicum]|nr:hypothetical protein MKX01_016467 [Papaver californicum]
MVRKKKKPQKVNGDGEGKEERDVKCLAEAFSLVSLEEVNSAYKEAQGNSNKAAEILSDLMMNVDNDSSRGGACSISTSSSFYESSSNNSEERMTSSSSSSSEMFWESDIQRAHDSSGMGFVDCKAKRVIATAGTVSSVLGKDYVRSSPLDKDRGRGGGEQQHYNSPKWKNSCIVNGVTVGNEEAEHFLFSMLGDGCDLSMAVVRDVFCQCGYDVEKAADVLLDFSSSSYIECNFGKRGNLSKGHTADNSMRRHQVKGMSQTKYNLFGKEIPESMSSLDRDCRAYSEVLLSSKESRGKPVTTESLPQVVLESLFNVPQSAEANPESMNFKNVVKKIESCGHKLGFYSTGAAEPPDDVEYAKGEEYQVFREDAKHHWEKMRLYHQKAATAFSRGEKDYAAYLSDQGRVENKMAREADKKASKKIFEAINKGIKNVITIDLHGQHVEQAIREVKVHLIFMMNTSSVQLLRVITGCGVGKGTVKQSVIRLAEKAGAEWKEENQGVVTIKVVGRRECDFLESDSDTE